MSEIKMSYSKYKKHYADCETMMDYDSASKTITVLVPDGRMKTSGTRGKRFGYYDFSGVEIATGRRVNTTIKAIDIDHATSNLLAWCGGVNWDIKS